MSNHNLVTQKQEYDVKLENSCLPQGLSKGFYCQFHVYVKWRLALKSEKLWIDWSWGRDGRGFYKLYRKPQFQEEISARN